MQLNSIESSCADKLNALDFYDADSLRAAMEQALCDNNVARLGVLFEFVLSQAEQRSGKVKSADSMNVSLVGSANNKPRAEKGLIVKILGLPGCDNIIQRAWTKEAINFLLDHQREDVFAVIREHLSLLNRLAKHYFREFEALLKLLLAHQPDMVGAALQKQPSFLDALLQQSVPRNHIPDVISVLQSMFEHCPSTRSTVLQGKPLLLSAIAQKFPDQLLVALKLFFPIGQVDEGILTAVQANIEFLTVLTRQSFKDGNGDNNILLRVLQLLMERQPDVVTLALQQKDSFLHTLVEASNYTLLHKVVQLLPQKNKEIWAVVQQNSLMDKLARRAAQPYSDDEVHTFLATWKVVIPLAVSTEQDTSSIVIRNTNDYIIAFVTSQPNTYSDILKNADIQCNPPLPDLLVKCLAPGALFTAEQLQAIKGAIAANAEKLSGAGAVGTIAPLCVSETTSDAVLSGPYVSRSELKIGDAGLLQLLWKDPNIANAATAYQLWCEESTGHAELNPLAEKVEAFYTRYSEHLVKQNVISVEEIKALKESRDALVEEIKTHVSLFERAVVLLAQLMDAIWQGLTRMLGRSHTSSQVVSSWALNFFPALHRFSTAIEQINLDLYLLAPNI